MAKKIQCKICDKYFSVRGIGTHVLRMHNLSPQEYYKKYVGDNKCKVCGKQTNFRSINEGYLTYCSIRCANLDNSIFVTDNPQKNKNTREKSMVTFAKSHNGAKTPFQIDKSHKKAIKNSNSEQGIQKRVESKNSNIKKFCKENNCITLKEAEKLNKNKGWKKDIEFIRYGNYVWCISKSYIDYIKNYKSFIGKSKKEYELYGWLKSKLDIEVVHNDRVAISPYELDIFLPSKNLAIEFNGVYWHSIENNTSKDYHLMKSLLCREKNIRLVHIYEFEDFNQQKELLLNLLNGKDRYNKNDFNKNNLIKNIPNAEIIYSQDNLTLYGAGKLYKI